MTVLLTEHRNEIPEMRFQFHSACGVYLGCCRTMGEALAYAHYRGWTINAQALEGRAA